MEDLQKNKIYSVQPVMDECITDAFNLLEERFLSRLDVLSNDEMVKFELNESIRVKEEILDIQHKNPALRTLEKYVLMPNFLWESDLFFGSLSREERRKWYESDIKYTSYDFCKDEIIFDSDFPYFSLICKIAVNERYLKFLESRRECRKQFEINNHLELLALREKQEEEKMNSNSTQNENDDLEVSNLKVKKAPQTKDIAIYSFEYIITDSQIKYITKCVNEVRMFHGEITFDQMKALFNCQSGLSLKSANNRLIAYFFDLLSNRYYITDKWQSVIARNKLILSSKKDSYLNQDDISSALNGSKYSTQLDDFDKINRCITSLKEH